MDVIKTFYAKLTRLIKLNVKISAILNVSKVKISAILNVSKVKEVLT